MGLRKDLQSLSKYADNPYEAKYRPEKELKRFTVLLLVLLPFLLGYCCQFYILVVGPLSIYWFIMFAKCNEYWKVFKWKRWKLFLPTAILAIIGLYLAFSMKLVEAVDWVIAHWLGF